MKFCMNLCQLCYGTSFVEVVFQVIQHQSVAVRGARRPDDSELQTEMIFGCVVYNCDLKLKMYVLCTRLALKKIK